MCPFSKVSQHTMFARLAGAGAGVGQRARKRAIGAVQKYAGTIYATAGGDTSFATLNNTFILRYQGLFLVLELFFGLPICRASLTPFQEFLKYLTLYEG